MLMVLRVINSHLLNHAINIGMSYIGINRAEQDIHILQGPALRLLNTEENKKRSLRRRRYRT